MRATQLNKVTPCKLLLLALSGCVCTSIAADPPVDLSKLPPPIAKQIDYDHDIRPLFEKSCFRCHGPERPKSHFRLDQHDAALKGGEDNPGKDIIERDSANSPLI